LFRKELLPGAEFKFVQRRKRVRAGQQQKLPGDSLSTPKLNRMFSLHQIKQASARVQSGADFPEFVQDLVKIGVTEYVTFVRDGHTVYFGEEDFSIQSEEIYDPILVTSETNKEKFMDYLKDHQQGLTDYRAFCKKAAEVGVDRWDVDMNEMTCTYYNKLGEKVLVETIPLPQAK